MTDTNAIATVKDFFDRHGGVQRSNRFSVKFNNLPSGLPDVNPNDFKVESVTMAARAIDSIADNLAGYGSGRSVPRSQRFVPGVLVTFPVTNDTFILDFMNSWFNRIYAGGRLINNNDFSFRNPFQLEYYDNIVFNCSMEVNLLDLNGNLNRKYTFYEVYPIENIPVDLNMAEPNTILKYQVLFNYREFKMTGPST